LRQNTGRRKCTWQRSRSRASLPSKSQKRKCRCSARLARPIK
jgi:hypothetical protein